MFCFVGLLFVVFVAKNLIHILLTLIHIVLMYILESLFVCNVDVMPDLIYVCRCNQCSIHGSVSSYLHIGIKKFYSLIWRGVSEKHYHGERMNGTELPTFDFIWVIECDNSLCIRIRQNISVILNLQWFIILNFRYWSNPQLKN